ncbi:hypothetical protein CCO03_16970 [Comamonas serinivorans]|uniref:YfbU family protein n=1 Tax=Comamonas serinivorans TaxID=1082851 RepID=A0A1Y0ERK6_9BURK|nr:YfbU family protein [Comamonas serinivorans]ARU06138.1 hypothetical protein CCO03_16970 [Comamonas serinivorans]
MAKPISDVERLILANQYEILAELNEDDDLRRVSQHFKDGHKWLYDQVLDNLSPNLSKDDEEFVLSVMELYRSLDSSYDALTDKAGLTPRDVAYKGFDGNNEAELMGFAKALNDAGRYTESDGELNSHTQMSSYYQRLIARHEEMGSPQRMTAEQIQSLLN